MEQIDLSKAPEIIKIRDLKITVPMEMNRREEVFSHRDEDGTYRHFPSQFMYKFAVAFFGRCTDIVACELPLTAAMIQHIRERKGIEQERVDRLTYPFLRLPLVGIFWDDATPEATIIDGNHRAVKLFELGRPSAQVFCFKKALWEQMLLPLKDDDNFLTRNSGILARDAQTAKLN